MLDDATGCQIPGAQVCVEAIKRTGKAGDWATTDDNTDKDGRFHFSEWTAESIGSIYPALILLSSREPIP